MILQKADGHLRGLQTPARMQPPIKSGSSHLIILKKIICIHTGSPKTGSEDRTEHAAILHPFTVQYCVAVSGFTLTVLRIYLCIKKAALSSTLFTLVVVFFKDVGAAMHMRRFHYLMEVCSF